jgi:hypothetical protein
MLFAIRGSLLIVLLQIFCSDIITGTEFESVTEYCGPESEYKFKILKNGSDPLLIDHIVVLLAKTTDCMHGKQSLYLLFIAGGEEQRQL